MSERVNLPSVVEVEVRVEGDHTAEADIHPVGHTEDGPEAGAEKSTPAGGGRGLRTAETGTGTGTPGGNIPVLDPDPDPGPETGRGGRGRQRRGTRG